MLEWRSLYQIKSVNPHLTEHRLYYNDKDVGWGLKEMEVRKPNTKYRKFWQPFIHINDATLRHPKTHDELEAAKSWMEKEWTNYARP